MFLLCEKYMKSNSNDTDTAPIQHTVTLPLTSLRVVSYRLSVGRAFVDEDNLTLSLTRRQLD